jgi:hypothetical protein
MFWKDPFSDSPGKLIPVRQEDRELLAAYDRKGRRGDGGAAREPRDSEMARLRAEIDAARAEAAATRAENARLAEQLMSEDRRECVADNDARAEVRMRRRASGGSGRAHRHESRQQMAFTSSVQSEANETPAAPPSPEPIIPATVAPPNPGMVITPLPVSAPSPSPLPMENGRRGRSSRPSR